MDTIKIIDFSALVLLVSTCLLVINRRLRQHDSYCIYSDQQRTSAEAVAQLIALGHRDIAFITGSLDSPTGRERLAGYHAALAQHQLVHAAS